MQKYFYIFITKICSNENIIILGSELAIPKPNPELGLIALNYLKIDKSLQLHIFHVGDSLNTDIPFAKNIDLVLKEYNPLSSCHEVYFALKFDYTNEKELPIEAEAVEVFMKIYGFGKLGSFIRNVLNPYAPYKEIKLK